MNMDYSKAFELLNQDTEKGLNEKAKKAVHDNLYNKGFRDGLAVLDKIRAEIEQLPITDTAVRLVTEILDKYKAESEG